jgi:hypothetical protein
MKLTLTLDDGKELGISCEGPPENRLEMLEGLCVMLDSWASSWERDKQEEDDSP